ncbi:hypothetical protein ACFQYP_24760 [Nonomuraea antimicrobica]
MIELAALDIAGTTVDERGAVYQALEESVRAAGGTPTPPTSGAGWAPTSARPSPRC